MSEVSEKLFVTLIYGSKRRWCTARMKCEARADFVGPLRQLSGGPECTAYCQECLPDDACVKQEEEPKTESPEDEEPEEEEDA